MSKDIGQLIHQTCVFCNASLTEPDEIEIHGDICHDCAWLQTPSSKYHMRKQKREGKSFTFNSNNHHDSCTCLKCKSIISGRKE